MSAVGEITLKKACRPFVAFIAAAGFMFVAVCSMANAATGLPEREADPVVLTGSQLPGLIGAVPGEIVAFSWDGSWKQVPVQVDERKIADFRAVRQVPMYNAQFMAEVYADPNTWTGADGVPQKPTNLPNGDPIPDTAGDPLFDADDEIALMSRHAGASAFGLADPEGVDAGTRTPVGVSDSLDDGNDRFLYLFTSGSLDPDANQDLVSYDWIFSPPLVGGYFAGYEFSGLGDNVLGPPVNPEASVVRTDNYEQTFPGRWMVDGLKIKAGGATGVDILDGDKSMVILAAVTCGRNELTFSRGQGAVVANIDGPVRAVRSFVGANSGTYTQRDQIYYESRVDTNTYLRVHEGITDFVLAMDYSEDAFGMTYRSSTNEAGVTIDGQPDEGVDGQTLEGNIFWDQATGVQGSLTNVSRVDSDIPGLTYGTFYEDNMTPPANKRAILCSGDDHAIGASGPRLKMPGFGFNTDPTRPPTAPSTEVNNLTGHRTTYFSGPGATAETGKLRSRQVETPLVVSSGTNIDQTPVTEEPGNPTNPGKPGRKNWVGLKVTAGSGKVKARIGKRLKIRVKVRNIGDKTARKIRICPRAKNRLVKTSRCKSIGKLKPSHRSGRTFAVRLRGAAAGKKAVKVRFRAKATKSHARADTVSLLPRGN
ncbi:MAG: hypothetical protein WBW44_12185 [Solirubrobacterales bacterium]